MSKVWALILGGSSGLGLATAKKLVKHGYHIIVVHRDRRSDMDAISKHFDVLRSFGSQVLTFNVDAIQQHKKEELIQQISAKLPKEHTIKVLVHSIAKGNLKPMYALDNQSLTAQDVHITFEAMALSLYEWTIALIKEKLFHKDTRIIAFTSEGNTKALPNYAAVSVAKVALEALTRNMAVEFAPLGIKANCIQAGVTETKALSMIPNFTIIREHALARNPNCRLTTPDDVANGVYLLTLEEAKWITGTTIKVDGGESLK